MKSRIFQFIVIGLLVASSIVSALSLLPGMDWARFDRTSSVGPIDYTLTADFDAVGFEYRIETAPSGSGGIIGGMGGDLGSNVQRDEPWKAYPQVDRSVLENLGIIYDSYKEKTFQYELVMRDPPQESGVEYQGTGSPSARLNVTLRTELVPFWPEDGSQTLDVDIIFTGADLLDQVSSEERANLRIDLKKITVLAKVNYDPESDEYTGEPAKLKEMELEEEFTEIGDSYHRSIDVEYPNGEDVAGFMVRIEASLTDYWGRQERSPLSGTANPINIRPVETMMILRGAGIAMALPLILISVILSITGAIVILVTKRSCLGLVIPSSILSILGVSWYWSGMSAAVEILGRRLAGAEDGLEWGAGIFLAVIAALIMLLMLGLAITAHVLKKGENRDNIDTEEPSPMKFRKLPGDEKGDSKGTSGSAQPKMPFRKVPGEGLRSQSEAPKPSVTPPPPPMDPFSRP